MSVVKTSMLLLLLLAAISTNADDKGCDDLKLLAKEDLLKVYGDWVLVWAVADHQEGIDLLPNVSSSHVELHLLPDSITVVFNERNMLQDKSCVNYYINMTLPEDGKFDIEISSAKVEINGIPSDYNDTGVAEFYEAGPDRMMMLYKSSKGRFLLNYRSEGHHQDMEQMKANQAAHQKHAECLAFPHDRPFIYDGVADFCHKKSSPDVTGAPAVEEKEMVEPTRMSDH